MRSWSLACLYHASSLQWNFSQDFSLIIDEPYAVDLIYSPLSCLMKVSIHWTNLDTKIWCDTSGVVITIVFRGFPPWRLVVRSTACFTCVHSWNPSILIIARPSRSTVVANSTASLSLASMARDSEVMTFKGVRGSQQKTNQLFNCSYYC